MGLYPPAEPFRQGELDAGDGHTVYWEACGNPRGKPAVVLHGGPGSGCSPAFRRLFDPRAYQVILFDQRNCGRSRPHASDPHVDLSTNTTEHLLGDIELLRNELGVERWLVFGMSWGSTLALAYAERYPQRVSEVVLAGVTMTRSAEVEWLSQGLRRFFPAEWARFSEGAGGASGSLVEAYHRLLFDPDPAVRARAARDWCDWEIAMASLDPRAQPHPRYESAEFRLAFARIVTHYFSHAAWLEDGALLRGAGAIAGIPGVMVHGRLDLQAPLQTAWELSRAWPSADLVVVENAGHDSRDPGMYEAIVAATDRFRS